MKRLYAPILSVLVILSLSASALASTPVVGQSVIYRHNSTHHYAAIVTGVWEDGTADLVMFNTYLLGYSFGFGWSSRYDWPATYLEGVTEGTTDNRWAVNPNIGLGATGATGPGALVTGQSTPSLTLNGSAAVIDSTHDAELTVTVTVANSITIAGGTAGHVDLVCDSSSTPTTVVETVSAASTGTVVVGITLNTSNTLVLRWRVAAGHSCKLATVNDTGAPSFTLVRQIKQTLGN